MIPLIDLNRNKGGLRGFQHIPSNPLKTSIVLNFSSLSDISYYKFVSFVLFIILCVFLFRIFTAKDNSKDLTTFKLNLDELDTGDLLFVSYTNTFGYFMRGWTNSVWTHTAMIMRDKEDLYVIETADYTNIQKKKKSGSDFYKKGILVIPFEIWKSFNSKNKISISKLQTPSNFDRRRFVLEFWKIQNEKLDQFDGGLGVIWKVLWKKRFDENEEKKKQNIACFELIVKIFQNTGVAKKIYSPSSYYTSDLIERKLELNEGFKFELAKVLK